MGHDPAGAVDIPVDGSGLLKAALHVQRHRHQYPGNDELHLQVLDEHGPLTLDGQQHVGHKGHRRDQDQHTFNRSKGLEPFRQRSRHQVVRCRSGVKHNHRPEMQVTNTVRIQRIACHLRDRVVRDCRATGVIHKPSTLCANHQVRYASVRPVRWNHSGACPSGTR